MYYKRLTIGLLPEWKETLIRLKKDKFFDKSMAELLRYVISVGIKTIDLKK